MILRLPPHALNTLQLPRTAILILILLIAPLVACRSKRPAAPEIQVDDVWSRPAAAMGETSGGSNAGGLGKTNGQGGTGVVYMKLVNRGQEADRLIGAQTDVAEVVEIHETQMEGDVMKMQLLASGVEIPAAAVVAFNPGGYHLMLVGLKRELKAGDTFPVMLEFDKSGVITVEAQVRQP